MKQRLSHHRSPRSSKRKREKKNKKENETRKLGQPTGNKETACRATRYILETGVFVVSSFYEAGDANVPCCRHPLFFIFASQPASQPTRPSGRLDSDDQSTSIRLQSLDSEQTYAQRFADSLTPKPGSVVRGTARSFDTRGPFPTANAPAE